jgi:hypothetical protein
MGYSHSFMDDLSNLQVSLLYSSRPTGFAIDANGFHPSPPRPHTDNPQGDNRPPGRSRDLPHVIRPPHQLSVGVNDCTLLSAMYTLHKLKESRKRPHNSLEGSTYDDTRNALSGPSEPAPFDPTTVGDTYPWGFEEGDIDSFPALKRRNFWCIQRHQARGVADSMGVGKVAIY